ncbi:MAG: LysE family translocator [Pseudomonadota bacterium]
MTVELITGLAVFTLVAAITPGPNNLMLMASGVNFGIRRTLPHLWGVVLGFTFMILLISLGIGQLFQRFPASYEVLRVVSVIYMLWLAWKIATASEPGSGGEGSAKPLTFMQAAAFQWVNPKGWTMGITAVTLYSLGSDWRAAILMAVIFGAVTLPCSGVWAVLGQQMRGFLHTPRRLLLFNVGMAVLLILSLYPVLWPSV